MPEAVPLCAGLGVEGVDVVVGEGGDEGLDVVLEGLAFEAWDLWFVERKARVCLAKTLKVGTERLLQRDDIAVFDVGFCGFCDAGWGQEVNATDLVVGAPDPGGTLWCFVAEVWELLAGWEGRGVWVPWEG